MDEKLTILEKVRTLEKQVDKLEVGARQSALNELALQKDIEVIKIGMADLKADLSVGLCDMKESVIEIVNVQAERTWKLIFVLVAIVTLLTGLKIVPEMLKLFTI